MDDRLQIADLRTEYQRHPLGIDEEHPRFSWKLISETMNVKQMSYRILVKDEKEVVWDSQKRAEDKSVAVVYDGKQLNSYTEYRVSVQVWDNYEREAKAEGIFETGLMKGGKWEADWITAPTITDEEKKCCPVFKYTFKAKHGIKRGRLYAAACGMYEAYINAKKAGDVFFAPGWTSYHNHILYQTYDVTGQLMGSKENELTLIVGNGWYKGYLGFMDKPDNYGDRTGVSAMLRIEYDDGTNECICTGTDWDVCTEVIMESEIYYGETQDFTSKASYLGKAELFTDKGIGKLESQSCEPVRITKRFDAKRKLITPKGELVIDFGQNMAGFVEVSLPHSDEGKLVLYHAETLDKDGNFYPETLRSAISRDEYRYSKEHEGMIAAPHFTFHGFRYIRLEGVDEAVDIKCFTACALHTDMRKIGSFKCDNELVQQLVSNIEWSQRSNFLDIPTDCPQRNERLGWTGDAQVFCNTAAFQFETERFFEKWLKDLALEQTKEYGVPHVVPNILGQQPGAAGWSDCAVIIPWNLYQAYGDIRILENQFDSMKGWVDYISDHCRENGLWQDGYQYGDWLGLDAEKSEAADNRNGATDRYLAANAYYAYVTKLVEKAANVLKRKADAEKYHELYEKIVESIQKEYVTQTGRLVSETQTACVLMLYFDLLKKEDRARVLETLEANLAAHRNHLTTGFMGTPYLCLCLTENGRHDLAESVFLKEDCPGWLYAVKKGATTMWERWDSIKPDGNFDESGMNSLNHYANGSIGEWLYTKTAGIVPLEPGYKKIKVAPILTHGMTEVFAELESPYGTIRSSWKCKDYRISIDVMIPANTCAELWLPEKNDKVTVGSGVWHYEYGTESKTEIDRYTMESTLGEIVAEPKAVVFFNNVMPGMLDGPMIQYAYGMTLSELTAMAKDAEPLYREVLRVLNGKGTSDGRK